MKFLIPTEPDDTHAILVKLALESMDQEVRLLFTADQPTKLKNSVLIDNNSYQWRNKDQYITHVDNDYEVVWWRRPRKPHLPKDNIHPSDYKFVVRENTLFFESLTNTMAPNARWVNNKEAATRANSKLLQLKLAVECGMSIPTTLCSNDPQDIADFLVTHGKKSVVYKPFCSNFWFEEGRMKIAYTSKPSLQDFPSDRLLQLTPGIFQKEIKKNYELRITYFDGFMVAAKLNSQDYDEGKIDWRAIPGMKMKIDPYVLPRKLEQQIQSFMKKMGLVFGVLDFIVSEELEYIFLEVNEQGQFLWIEDFNPDFKMLDIFIQFLLTSLPSFKWEPKNSLHSIEKYQQQIADIRTQNMQRHVALNNANAYQE